MQISGHTHYTGTASCPNLLEWTGWTSSFCRLRYMASDVLSSSEIQDYCRNRNHTTCVYYVRQVDMIAENYVAQEK